jgi:hypothetical protein
MWSDTGTVALNNNFKRSICRHSSKDSMKASVVFSPYEANKEGLMHYREDTTGGWK